MVSAEGNPVAGQTSGIISLGFNAGGTADSIRISVPEYSHVFRDFLRCPEMIKSYDY